MTDPLLRSRARFAIPPLAALAFALLPAVAHAATRTGTLDVSITILAQCSIQTSSWLQPLDAKRLYLSGETTGTVLVQCSRGIPFSLAWRREPAPIPSAAIRVVPFGTAPFNPYFDALLMQDSPLSFIDNPSRLVLPEVPGQASPAEIGPSAPLMIVVTF